MIVETAITHKTKTRSIVLDAAWILFFASVFALVKVVERYADLRIPGHSAALWLPVLFLSGCVVRRRGAVVLTAAAGGLLSVIPHLPHPMWIAGYVAAAFVVDAGLARLARPGILPWVMLGILAGLAKFALKCAAPWSGFGAHFLSFGLMAVAGSHAFFGGLGGLLGAIAARFLTARVRHG